MHIHEHTGIFYDINVLYQYICGYTDTVIYLINTAIDKAKTDSCLHGLLHVADPSNDIVDFLIQGMDWNIANIARSLRQFSSTKRQIGAPLILQNFSRHIVNTSLLAMLDTTSLSPVVVSSNCASANPIKFCSIFHLLHESGSDKTSSRFPPGDCRWARI
jgi:hypothetical protein